MIQIEVIIYENAWEQLLDQWHETNAKIHPFQRNCYMTIPLHVFGVEEGSRTLYYEAKWGDPTSDNVWNHRSLSIRALRSRKNDSTADDRFFFIHS